MGEYMHLLIGGVLAAITYPFMNHFFPLYNQHDRDRWRNYFGI